MEKKNVDLISIIWTHTHTCTTENAVDRDSWIQTLLHAIDVSLAREEFLVSASRAPGVQ